MYFECSSTNWLNLLVAGLAVFKTQLIHVDVVTEHNAEAVVGGSLYKSKRLNIDWMVVCGCLGTPLSGELV